MKRLLALVAIFLAASSALLSQKASATSYFTITAGPSFPVSNFGSRKLRSEASGLAATGQSLNFSYVKAGDNHFGFAFELRGQRNPLAVKDMESELATTGFAPTTVWFSDGTNNLPPQQPGIKYKNWDVKRKAWLSVSALGGLYAAWPVGTSQQTTFFAKGLVGAVYVKSPSIDANSVTDTATVHLEQNSRSAFGFTYSVATGFHFKTRRKMFFEGGVNYTGTSKLNFNKVVAKSLTIIPGPDEPGASYSGTQLTGTGHQVLSTINLNVGVGWYLD